jgi:hypothetical protein
VQIFPNKRNQLHQSNFHKLSTSSYSSTGISQELPVAEWSFFFIILIADGVASVEFFPPSRACMLLREMRELEHISGARSILGSYITFFGPQ